MNSDDRCGPLAAVTQADLRRNPHAVWNGFVGLLAMTAHQDLAPRQRPAHLAFWYDSEVQNGGHFQYFENRGLELVPETIAALEYLDAGPQALVLEEALALASGRAWGAIESAEDFISEAAESGLFRLDRAYGGCRPELIEVLERHLAEHQSWFVLVEDPLS